MSHNTVKIADHSAFSQAVSQAGAAGSVAFEAPGLPPPAQGRRPLGEILMDMGALSAQDLAKALALRARQDVRFGDILLAHNMVSSTDLYAALATQFGTTVANLRAEPPDVRLIDRIKPEFCIQNGIVPWKRVGGATVIICSQPDEFARLADLMPEGFGRLHLAVAPEEDIQEALVAMRHRSLAQRAESRVAEGESCRSWNSGPSGRMALALVIGLIALFLTSPVVGFALLTSWAVLTLLVNSGLKAIAAVIHLRREAGTTSQDQSTEPRFGVRRLPTVSIMVPLFKEREIAGRLVKRLSKLSYPRELLDICLVVEEDDTLTQQTLARSDLPRWMRQITVPRGAVRTKPRALNFALDFCRGTIIGVYDAEDAPDPDQIHKIVRRFAERPVTVACLQGVLDFYNAPKNWLSRCFTIEYATWFRIVLPGLEKMGFAVPLGGTTLFFRRAVLEELGGWDAHNVTEDADLGIRLARHGYRTELINTVTQEEANCFWWPWVKQRSRWIKGYAMTYGVHMRHPMQLLRDVGPWKALGVQFLFLGTLSQFLLAPVLWSFWAVAFGLSHPLLSVMPDWMFWTLGGVFLFSEVLTISVGVLATSGDPNHHFLRKWVPTLHFYFPLATLAALKGMSEIVTKPFYWDKTQHGATDAPTPSDLPEAVNVRSNPA
ncbi:MAG: glycosyltransferase family 2 protein [Maritimibacter sp.]